MRLLLAVVLTFFASMSIAACIDDPLSETGMKLRFKNSVNLLDAAKTSFELEDVKSELICLSDHQHVPASMLLAWLFLGNAFGEMDQKDAQKYLDISFNNGNIDVKLEVAQLYMFGKLDDRELGVDIETAIKYFQKASTLGSARASASICSVYRTDAYKREDFGVAISYCRVAFEQGDIVSEIDLAKLLYQHGTYPSDSEEAVTLFFTSALRGTNVGPLWLGRAYEEGKGVLQNFGLAHAWYNIASSRLGPTDQKEAADARDRVSSKLNADQIIEAQVLAKSILRDMASYQP